MYLGGTGVAQHLDYRHAGGAADYGVVYQHYALALYVELVHVELEMHGVLAHALIRRYEGAAYVLALYEGGGVGYAALHGVAKRRVQAGIRHAAHYVGLDRMLARQRAAGLLAPLAYANAIHHAVRAGKVYILEHAARGLGRGMARHGAHAVLVD